MQTSDFPCYKNAFYNIKKKLPKCLVHNNLIATFAVDFENNLKSTIKTTKIPLKPIRNGY